MQDKMADIAGIVPRGGYDVLRADLKSDRSTILDLLTRNEPRASSLRDQLVWHLETNPHGKGHAWLLLKTPESKPVGVISALPRRLWVAGEIRPAARLWTMAVEKEHRTLGPAIMLLKAALNDLHNDVDFVYAMPHNLNSTNLLTRVGFGKIARLERRVRVLRSNDYLDRMVRRVVPLLSTLVVPLIAPAADLIAGLVADRHASKASNLEITCIGGFDQRFDKLWERARPHYQFASERTAEFLGWRFRRSWDTYLTLGFREKSSRRLVGYAVIIAEEPSPKLYDFFLEDPMALTDPALWLLVDWLRKRCFRSLTAMFAGTPGMRRAFADRWFVERSTKPPESPTADKRRRPGSSPTDENEFTVMGAISPKRHFPLPNPASLHFTLADDI